MPPASYGREALFARFRRNGVHVRQEQVEADIQRAWLIDPVAYAERKGTQEVYRREGLARLAWLPKEKTGGAGGNRTHA